MKKIAYLSLVMLGLTSSVAMAETAIGTLTVKATVIKSCAVNTSATGTINNAVIDFGTLTSLTQNVDANTSSSGSNKISVLCTNTTPWSIALDAGKNVSTTQRRMAGGTSEFIPYNLYIDTARTTAIGINTAALTGTGNGQQQSYEIYGRIPAGSTLPSPGAYLDTVTITVTY